MFLDRLVEFPGFILELLTLSDQTFHHLLGLLAVIAFLRLFIPLHHMMTRELAERNEIADLAEDEGCTEYDIFIKAHKYYYGTEGPERVKRDFIVYLMNWPDNYILPFYIRNYLEELMRDNTDSRHRLPANNVKSAGKKLSGCSHV